MIAEVQNEKKTPVAVFPRKGSMISCVSELATSM